MTLLSQAFAVLVAAALVSWRARFRSASFSIGAGAAVAVAGILTFVALSGFWAQWQGFRSERRANALISPADAAVSGSGASAGPHAGFVEWLNANIPARAPFYISTDGSDPGTYQWLLYRLYPRVALEDRSRAHWLVFLHTTPEAAGFKRSDFARYMRYSTDSSLGERR